MLIQCCLEGGDEDVLIVGREVMKILLDIALSMITKGFKDKNNVFFLHGLK